MALSEYLLGLSIILRIYCHIPHTAVDRMVTTDGLRE